MTSRLGISDQIPHPLCMGIKFPTPGKVKVVKLPGYARGRGGGGKDVEASI